MTPTAIRELRNRLRESQAHFGERFQVSQITVAYWESGRSQPAPRRLSELAILASSATPAKTPLPAFRPIQYLGSKQRLAETIATVLSEVAPGASRVGDLFAGSGVVSSLLGTNRPVTAVDIQAFSQALTTALLHGQAEHYAEFIQPEFMQQVSEFACRISHQVAPLLEFEAKALQKAASGDPEDLIHLMEFGSLAIHDQRPLKNCPPRLAKLLSKVVKGLKTSEFNTGDLTAIRYFGGPYFSYTQAIELDAIYMAANALRVPSSKSCVLAVLLSTASEIVNTVGKQFAQPMKLKKADGRIPPLLLQRALRDRTLNTIQVFQSWTTRWQEHVLPSNDRHRVVCSDVIEFAVNDRDCSVYYADPPYTIDHYSRFYHVLETLVLRDSPRLDEMKKRGELSVMRGVYRIGRHQSSFCVPSSAPAAFDKLFAATARREAPLVLSYSPFDEEEGHRPRLLTLPDLVATAKRHYPHVSVMEITEHSHRKLNTKTQNVGIRNDAERLLICKV